MSWFWEIANKTYVQEQSDLHRAIFKGYDKKVCALKFRGVTFSLFSHVFFDSLDASSSKPIRADQRSNARLHNGLC